MREQIKAERIRILGAPVDPIRVDRAMNLTSHYLEKNKFEYIINPVLVNLLGQDFLLTYIFCDKRFDNYDCLQYI